MHPSLRRAALVALGTGGLGLVLIEACSGVPCVSTGLRHGVWLPRCPASALRASASLALDDVERRRWGRVEIGARAHWIDPDGHTQSTEIRPRHATLELLGPDGEPVPGLEIRDARSRRHTLVAELKLPDLPDGDYTLRARVHTPFETRAVDAELPLFRPALIHTISDRPLYRPGQDVLLRAAVLDRSARLPLAGRPGVWLIEAPDGTTLLHENATTDAWGVAATRFPLAVDAPEGRWTARFQTGTDAGSYPFDVHPFQLPRTELALHPDRSWYRPGMSVRIEGQLRSIAGTPVTGTIRLTAHEVRGTGLLPDWSFPIVSKTGPDGRFTLDLGPVPPTFRGRVEARLDARATDPSGEEAVAHTTVVLSSDPIAAEVVTAYDGGLLPDRNNRLYLRLTRPDGVPLPERRVQIRNPYRPDGAPAEGATDADGVAVFQLDPGSPITLVEPLAPPVAATIPAPSLTRAVRAPGEAPLSLLERRAIDAVQPALEQCQPLALHEQHVLVGLQVDGGGRPTAIQGPPDPLTTCVVDALRAVRLPPGVPRSYHLGWTIPAPPLSAITARTTALHGPVEPARAAFEAAALQARRCLEPGPHHPDADLGTIHWHHDADGPLRSQSALTAGGLAPSQARCVHRELVRAALTSPSSSAAMGVTTFTLVHPTPPPPEQRATSLGFELLVETDEGRTTVRVPVGASPALRARVEPPVAPPGTTVEVELLRGPTFRGALPSKVQLLAGGRVVAEASVDPASRTARLTAPDGTTGFLSVRAGPARSTLFVQPPDPLQVELRADQDVFAPGEPLHIQVRTRAAEAPVPASVTLIGVDRALGALKSLPGSDDWGRATVLATGTAAFGLFGPRALQLGQIRGPNAARAAVLAVDPGSSPPLLPRGIRLHTEAHPDVETPLLHNFYRGVDLLRAAVRRWERERPPDRRLDPATHARLWENVLDEAERAGDPLLDGYGRPLRLELLPPDLLDQLAPHRFVTDATHLPEDVLDWSTWVRENR